MTKKELIEQVIEFKKEMKTQKRDYSNMFLVLNSNIFKREKFTFLGFSVIYDDNMKLPYYFAEFKSKKLSYEFVRRVEKDVNYKSR